MISVDDYLAHDAMGLAELVHKREVSATELLEVALTRAQQVNAQLNAIITPMHEIARARAAGPLEGPFAGVPFLLKDLEQDYAGVPTSLGCAALKRARWTPNEHSEITRRWLNAGVVPFGKTNTPEFGAKGITEPAAWGPTHNPWDLTRVPGGSSGGASAAVAAGIVPFAGANDGGGSIRIPSAYTGLFGLKPGRGRTPLGPTYPEQMHGAPVNHVLTRSVRDSARMLDVAHGPELGARFHIAPPERHYSDELAREPKRLRIAFSTRSALPRPVDPEAVRAVEATARLLESLGHHVEQGEPDIDILQLGRDFLSVWFANMAWHIDHVRELTGVRGYDGFEPDTIAMAAMGRAMNAVDYVSDYMRWNVYSRKLAEFHTRFDLLLTPTVATPAPRIGEVCTPPELDRIMRVLLNFGVPRLVALQPGRFFEVAFQNLALVPFTQLANLTGVPAMSVPLHVCDNGLPLGVQFVATHGGEGLLFSLAAQLERAAPWAQRLPVRVLAATQS